MKKGYLDIAQQFNKPTHEGYTKSRQDHYNRQMESNSGEVSFRKVTAQEINDLFWNVLLDLGWRLHLDSSEKRRIVLPCPDCNMLVDNRPYLGLSTLDTKQMESKDAVSKALKSHAYSQCQGRD